MEGLRTWVIFSWLAGVIGDPMSSQQFDKLHSKRVFFLRAYEVGGGYSGKQMRCYGCIRRLKLGNQLHRRGLRPCLLHFDVVHEREREILIDRFCEAG